MDLSNSLYSQASIYRPRATNAESRFLAAASPENTPPMEPGDERPDTDVDESPDINELATTQIREYVEQHFRGHEFAYLVGAVLQLQGYAVEVSPPGPDGGMDIIAGSGPLGFDPPRMCVQVKSGLKGIDPTVLRALAGRVQNSRADYGLLVSWGGFTDSTKREARQSNYFNIRLWDSEAFLNALFTVYDRLPADIRARIPIKQIWIVAEPH